MLLDSARRLSANVLLVLAATAVVIAVFEIALRWLEPVSDVEVLTETIDSQGPRLALRPNVEGLVLGKRVTVNAEGYRGTLVQRQKRPGVVRVLFFGDSHTFSMGADDERTYPAVAERKLSADGCPCEVLNFGVPGQDLRQILSWAQGKTMQYEPDLIVVNFHSGDILESADDVLPGSNRRGAYGTTAIYRIKVAALRHSYVARLVLPYGAAFLRRAFGLDPGVTVAEQREIERNGKLWQDLQTRILALKRDLDRRGITLAFVLFPSMVPFEDHPARGEYRALAAWLEAHAIPTLDLLPSFGGQHASQLTASLLDKHPNEQAYAIAGESVSTFVARLIDGRATRPFGTATRDSSTDATFPVPTGDGRR